ncbi:hypothetical protein QAD02_009219 [Eretmocerus hayati]|uniref:Uncharacterized protein n=1 Tax=Eretmocerus hayati TaxID=131215 RepID=A0ACC2NA23_9HYME|nr:hypothetical protein QAD02_009219 [Eretmocerus hayati]
MGELLIRRETLTEYETRYFMKQILDGVNYMHKQKIVHRDLKLQNIFLDKGLNVKIGDFGLSARIKSDGKKRRTCCGTLCFMAPEILSRTGHSYEADVWSLGCIMYMFIKGRIPFTPSELEPLEFAANIDGFEIWYELDGALQDELRKDDSPGMSMISRILRVRPLDRSTVEELINDPFLTSGYLPKKLPESCLTEAPTFDQLQAFNEEQRPAVAELDPNNNQYGLAKSLKILKEQLKSLFEFKTRIMECSDQKTEANYHPRIWVTKTTDQSAIYGFGYKLYNGSVGVLYNDATRLTMLGDHRNIVYTDQLGQESHHTISNHANHLIKKIVWLKSISNDFMDEKLDRKADAGCNCAGPHVHLHQWISTEAALMMLLTDGTLQINFAGQTILILSPIMASVTHVDQKKIVKTYCLKNLQKKWMQRNHCKMLEICLP